MRSSSPTRSGPAPTTTQAFAKTLSQLIKTVISSESMSEVTGQKLAIPENLHPKYR
ncbi:hypothetical protein [Streptomyces griseolus]|uniref:hypothetical protein n=1 Tax=Streptomyces griseolus TaxID=1909 RepID=UPI0022442B70|nr:hypothetical protein [Streptomyces griseolus]MCW8219541.1 hypothetical protein [Streptomyces griseolus]